MLLIKLVPSKRRHAGFDSSGAEGYEYQTDHGQSAATHGQKSSTLFKMSKSSNVLIINRETKKKHVNLC